MINLCLRILRKSFIFFKIKSFTFFVRKASCLSKIKLLITKQSKCLNFFSNNHSNFSKAFVLLSSPHATTTTQAKKLSNKNTSRNHNFKLEPTNHPIPSNPLMDCKPKPQEIVASTVCVYVVVNIPRKVKESPTQSSATAKMKRTPPLGKREKRPPKGGVLCNKERFATRAGKPWEISGRKKKLSIISVRARCRNANLTPIQIFAFSPAPRWGFPTWNSWLRCRVPLAEQEFFRDFLRLWTRRVHHTRVESVVRGASFSR